MKLPDDTDLLAEFYVDGSATQVLPPPGMIVGVVLFSNRLQDLSPAQPITLRTAIFKDPIATFSVIRCQEFLFAPAVVIPSGLFQFIVEGFDSTGLEFLFIEGPHYGLATLEPSTTESGTSTPESSEQETSEPVTSDPETSEPGTSVPETSEPETLEPEASEPEQLFTLTEGTVRPQNLTILRRQSARVLLTIQSTLSANRTRFTVRAITSFGLRVRVRPRRFILEPGSSRNIILRMRAMRRTIPGLQHIFVEVSSSVQQLTYTNEITVLRNQATTRAPTPTDMSSDIPTVPSAEPFECDNCLNGGQCFVHPESIPSGVSEIGCICTTEYTGPMCESELSVD
ncbi:uncharacterized protein [Dysidea avara]|uniref:uncharacterized protein n=1 Tax=Dysidea avara TaxID=196820 RepID=UPI00331A3F4A